MDESFYEKGSAREAHTRRPEIRLHRPETTPFREATMTRHELIRFPTPANPHQVEQFESRLEQISAAGGELVAFLPVPVAGAMIGVFRETQPGALAAFKHPD